jgi:hypothetical protein
MYKADIEYIIYVPTGLDTIRSMLLDKKEHLKNVLLGRKDVFCGWLYSENEFMKMFSNKTQKPMYIVKEKIELNDTAIYLLERNRQSIAS